MRAKQKLPSSHLLVAALWLSGKLCLLTSAQVAQGYQEEAGLECDLPAWALAGNLSASGQADYELTVESGNSVEQLPPAERLLGRRQVLEAEGRFESQLDYDAYRPPDFATPANSLDEELAGFSSSRSRASSEKESNQAAAAAPTSASSSSAPTQQQQQQPKSAPQFIKEPPSIIHYLNSSDLVIACSANGNPSPTIVSVRSKSSAVCR